MDGEGNRVLTCRFQIGPAALRRYFSLGKNGYDCRQATNTRRKNEAEARLFSSLPLTSQMGHSRPIPPIMADILCQLRPVRVRTGVARNM
jgi:hypothetical protein